MKKRILSILLLCCMVLTLLPTTVSAAGGSMDTIPAKYDVVIDLYNRTSDVNISDSKTYYIYSSVPDKLRPQWSWKKKIQIKGSSAAPHIFIDGLNIEVSPSAKTPAIEVNGKATAYLYFIGRDSTLQGATGRAAIQKNRSEGQVYVLTRTGTTVTCKGGEKAAGIGGSYATRNIFDGLYNGDMYGHGVNIHFGSQSNPDYWGGTIIADGGQGSAGIGAGQGGAGEKLYFYSGTVQATGGRWGSGIGGSYEGRGSEIYIYGGNVIATGVEGGAGIGGGCWKTAQDMNGINAAHDIYISGGMVTANGGYNGAGIGGGQYVPAHDISITGGYITANGVYGAGIGGGRWMHGKNITVTDAQLKLSTGRLKNGSDAAAMGYGDLVYKPEELVEDPSVATNDAIKIGSKKKGAIVWLKVEAHALTANGRSNFFWNLSDFLIPNERGLIDVSLLTLPYVQNYGWAITELEMTMMYTSCEDHVYGWKDWNGCHVWGCKRCFGRDPTKNGPVANGKHTPGDWDGWEKKCTVCGIVTTKDTTPPVIEGVVDGWDYTVNDNDDGTLGTIDFTVSDPAGEKETSSGVKSVTINGEEQTVQTGQIYQLTAPDGGNNDEGLWYEIVVTDKAGNSTTAKVRVYRRHRVLFVEDRERTKKYIEVGAPHGFVLDFPFNLPKEAYFIDLDDESIKVYYDEEKKTYNFGVINSNRTFLLVLPTELTVRVGNTSFWDYRADAQDEFSYVDPVGKDGEYGYSVTLGISSNQTSYYFATTARYTLEQLKELDKSGGIKWYQYYPEAWFTFIGPSFEDYHGEWYVYAKATNESGTKYVSSPRLILDCEDPCAIVYPSGRELEGKANSSVAGAVGTTYWGDLQFKVHDDTPVTVQDGKTVLEPDANGIYSIPADMADDVYHDIYIRDACGNTIFYLKNKVRCNTLIQVDTLSEQKLPHGAVLAESLPAEVSVWTAASRSQSVSVPVKWDETVNYVPAAKQEQHFTVTGTLDLSDTDIVVLPEQEALQTVTVEVTVAGAPQYRVTAASSENGTVTVTNFAKTTEDGTPLFCENDLVMLSIVPDEGYMLSVLSINGIPASFAVEDDIYTFLQPGKDVTITATFEKRSDHTITFDANGGSDPEDLPEEVTTAMPDKKVLHGSEYYLPECGFIAPEGKQFKAWQIDGTEYPVNAPVTVTADITVKVLWEDAPPAPVEYTVTVTTEGGGTASASPAKAAVGAEITLTATPNTGYHFKEWQVMSGGVTIKDDKFIMPSANVEVKAIFEEDAPPAPTNPAKPSISVTGTYTYNGSAHTVTVNGYDPTTMNITGNTATDAGDYTVSVTSNTDKWADGSTDAVTAAWSIGKATQKAPNGLNSLAPTEEGGSDGKITGVTDKMEYRMEGEYSYAACSGTEIENLSAGNYFVRYAEDNNHFASPDAAVTVGEGVPLADCTITFNGNGGSGNMDSVTVKAGTNYILPACGFTAPTDQEFKAWEIGTEYKVGDSYTMNGDIEIKALWKNSVITPTTYTVTVSNDGNGTGTANPSTAAAGMEITLTATPDKGYHFKEWQIMSGGVTIKDDKFLMPNDNVEVKAIFEKDAPPAPTEFIVTFDGNGGTLSVGSMTTTGQKLPSLPSASRSGSYSFDGWYTKKSGGTKISTDTLFTGNTTVYAHWTYTGGSSSGNSGSTSYPITVPDKTENGDVSISPKNASKGSAVIITVTPDSGYVLETISVTDKNGNDLKLTDKGNGKYTFTMPGSKVEVKVTFMEDNSVLNFFYDVPNDAYYYEAVKWAVENGITGGIGNSLFAPNQPCTRAQIVTFLWRAAGSPVVNYAMNMTDVAESAYYAEAVRWALSHGITTGTDDGKFSPDAACTRAQAVAFLFRAAVANGLEAVTLSDLISGFDDATSVPAYAVPAMNWALSQGIVKGSGTQLLPSGTCTRAQIVTFLYRAYQGN